MWWFFFRFFAAVPIYDTAISFTGAYPSISYKFDFFVHFVVFAL